jgi:DNA-binding CsgD family transcriptional regulator
MSAVFEGNGFGVEMAFLPGLGHAAPTVATLWHHLVRGQARIVHCGREGSYAALRIRALSQPQQALDARTASVLERLLLGESQKACAANVGLSVSSVTALAKRGLHTLGLGCTPSRVPLMLVIVVWAATLRVEFPSLSIVTQPFGADQDVLVSMPMPALWPDALSKAQRVVIGMMAEGYTYNEIAEARGTALRTVANQTTCVFHKLGISGRVELLAMIARSLAVQDRSLLSVA